jgi:hypothetical protein
MCRYIILCFIAIFMSWNAVASCPLKQDPLPDDVVDISFQSRRVDDSASVWFAVAKIPIEYNGFPLSEVYLVRRNQNGHYMEDFRVELAREKQNDVYDVRFLLSDEFLKTTKLEISYDYKDVPCKRFYRSINLQEKSLNIK